MKIIKKGKVPEPQKPWYLDVPFECENCKSIFEIESNDIYSVETERSIDGKSTLLVKCPVCSVTLQFVKGNRRLYHVN